MEMVDWSRPLAPSSHSSGGKATPLDAYIRRLALGNGGTGVRMDSPPSHSPFMYHDNHMADGYGFVCGRSYPPRTDT